MLILIKLAERSLKEILQKIDKPNKSLQIKTTLLIKNQDRRTVETLNRLYKTPETTREANMYLRLIKN
jgi:hypothetical protein